MSHPLPPMRQLTESLKAAGQLTAEDVKALADAGVKTLICNRPDQEEAGQPSTAELQALAESLGMQWFYQPVVSGQVMDEQGDDFGRILDQASVPVVAFCRSGARCGMLWALSQRHSLAGDKLVAILQKSGYDMPDFFKRLTD
ncbi:TIGR01244 family sulfur transferase [Nitrincola iocasae]|uniref:TIGR01244 family phosphatase n=1 Tax=Nitrincola iocasae TaxID=2614693 RepID=A0A5J6LAY1_9GAMM|nr:TIGR01244 family sulfur transferase [Nitrincola iocasae]QEW05422.1 TIGR01244 family phosphatase [Nitrincola iocasae]